MLNRPCAFIYPTMQEFICTILSITKLKTTLVNAALSQSESTQAAASRHLILRLFLHPHTWTTCCERCSPQKD